MSVNNDDERHSPITLQSDQLNQQPEGRDAEAKLLLDCSEIADNYRDGKVTKARALATIYAKISEAVGTDCPRQLENSFESYVDIINSYSNQEAAAEKRGRSRSVSFDDALQTDARQQTDKCACRSSLSERSKTLDIDEATTPWGALAFSQQTGSTRVLSPSLRKTNDLICLYTSNVKGFRRSLLNSDGCPEFPESEWTNILSGRVVNLDVVFGG
jgi:hypothetical protein